MTRQALNDPTVNCCGRDAADCDCAPAREHIVPIRYRSFKEDGMTLSECLLCGAVMGCPPDCDKNYIRVLQDRIRELAREINR